MLFVYLLIVPFSMSLFPKKYLNYSLVLLFSRPLNCFLLALSLKFSCHFPIQPSYLGPLKGTMKLTISCLFHWRHLENQGCVQWLGYYLQSLFHSIFFLFFTSWRKNLTSSVSKLGARFLGIEPCSSAEFRFIDILEMKRCFS